MAATMHSFEQDLILGVGVVMLNDTGAVEYESAKGNARVHFTLAEVAMIGVDKADASFRAAAESANQLSVSLGMVGPSLNGGGGGGGRDVAAFTISAPVVLRADMEGLQMDETFALEVDVDTFSTGQPLVTLNLTLPSIFSQCFEPTPPPSALNPRLEMQQ